MAELPLSNSDRPALVDDEDFLRHGLARWTWRLSSDGYPSRATRINGKRVVVKLHRLIAGAKPGQLVDHWFGDKLDNRKSKLRITDPTGNARNVRKPGRLKGVSWNKRGRKWEAAIGAGERKPNGKARRLYLGLYTDPAHAAQTYDRASLYYFGEFASLNFPDLLDAYLAQLTWDGIRSTQVAAEFAAELEAAE